jgi:hypothetical protein
VGICSSRRREDRSTRSSTPCAYGQLERFALHEVFGRVSGCRQHGSIAVIERFILSLKNEFLRRLTLPYNFERIEALLGAYHF